MNRVEREAAERLLDASLQQVLGAAARPPAAAAAPPRHARWLAAALLLLGTGSVVPSWWWGREPAAPASRPGGAERQDPLPLPRPPQLPRPVVAMQPEQLAAVPDDVVNLIAHLSAPQ